MRGGRVGRAAHGAGRLRDANPGPVADRQPLRLPGFTNTTPTTFADILAYTEQIWQFSWSR